MPDLEEPSEHVDYASYKAARPPVNESVGPHPFAESEFTPGCGRCDRCGGGPDAEIHQPVVDQMARIADALVDAGVAFEATAGSALPYLARIADALERIAGIEGL
jgi:hypothetical protein